MKKYLAVAVAVVAFAAVTVFIVNSADNALDQTRAINDVKANCLDDAKKGNKLDDNCKVIIRDLRGE